MIEVVELSEHKRWEGMVIPLEVYESLNTSSYYVDEDDLEDFWFEAYDYHSVTFDHEKHVIVNY